MRHLLLVAALFSVAASAQTYALRDFGRACGGNLVGQVAQNPQGAAVRLGVTGAIPNALAVLVMGSRAPAPIALPGSACLLLVDARATVLSQTNAQGAASFLVPLPSALPLQILFQVVVASLTTNGRAVTATDGLQLLGR